MRIRRLITIAAASLMAASATAVAAPMVVLYNTPSSNQQIIRPGSADALPVDGRLFVQEPNVGHLFAGDADKPFRLDHVMGYELREKQSAEAMAAFLKGRIDADVCRFSWGTVDCQSHLVFVDEIDWRFAEKGPNLNTRAWAGRTSLSQKKRKFPKYVPKAIEGHPGNELSQAMEILAATPWPGGGTYAERVHFYIAPGVVTSIGVGRGRYQNLGRDGRPHFRSHEGLRRALQLSGGVWLEMYHFQSSGRGRYPFNTYEWQVYPWRVAQYLTGPGAGIPDPAMMAKMHFMMSSGMPKNKGGAPAQCANPATPQGCQFALASSQKNQSILANGVGSYRMDQGNEPEWRGYVKQLFFSAP